VPVTLLPMLFFLVYWFEVDWETGCDTLLLVEGLHVDAKVGDRDSFLFAGVMVRGATLEEVGVQA